MAWQGKLEVTVQLASESKFSQTSATQSMASTPVAQSVALRHDRTVNVVATEVAR